MKKRQVYLLYSRSVFIYVGLLVLTALFIADAEASMEAVRGALLLCYRTLIPSLFPFFVLSGLLIRTGFVRTAGYALGPMMRPLLRVNGSGAVAFVIGVISGYPTGAGVVAELYRKKLIGRTEGRRLLPYCNNSGPLFIIGAVGVGMLASGRLGIFLYVVHIASALLVGFCFRFYGEAPSAPSARGSLRSEIGRELRASAAEGGGSFGEILCGCVSDSVHTTLRICGFIALFSAFAECVRPLFGLVLPNSNLRLLAEGMVEITMGASGAAGSALPAAQKLALISFLLGFGGVCVHLQVLGLLSGSGLGMKTYLAGKLLHGALAAAIAYAAASALPLGDVAAWSPSAAARAAGEAWRVLTCGALLWGAAAELLRSRAAKAVTVRKRG